MAGEEWVRRIAWVGDAMGVFQEGVGGGFPLSLAVWLLLFF